jgi:hypothetical protein
MKRRVCSYNTFAVPDHSFVLKDSGGEMYFFLGDSAHAGAWCALGIGSGQKRHSAAGDGAESEIDCCGNRPWSDCRLIAYGAALLAFGAIFFSQPGAVELVKKSAG